MLLSLANPIRRMPRRELRETHATVRAAPIVGVWPARPEVPALVLGWSPEPATAARVVVQLESERQAITVTDAFLATINGALPPDAHLVVTPAGRMSWVRRADLKPTAAE